MVLKTHSVNFLSLAAEVWDSSCSLWLSSQSLLIWVWSLNFSSRSCRDGEKLTPTVKPFTSSSPTSTACIKSETTCKCQIDRMHLHKHLKSAESDSQWQKTERLWGHKKSSPSQENNKDRELSFCCQSAATAVSLKVGWASPESIMLALQVPNWSMATLKIRKADNLMLPSEK